MIFLPTENQKFNFSVWWIEKSSVFFVQQNRLWVIHCVQSKEGGWQSGWALCKVTNNANWFFLRILFYLNILIRKKEFFRFGFFHESHLFLFQIQDPNRSITFGRHMQDRFHGGLQTHDYKSDKIYLFLLKKKLINTEPGFAV